MFNLTRYVAEPFVSMGGDGRERLLVVVKATYQLNDGTPRIAELQAPVIVADEYSGEPNQSSVLAANEIAFEKPSADCAIVGCAYPKGGKAAAESIVAMQVGALRKGAVVVGERAWVKSVGSVMMTKPLPFTRMPLVWERTFGGRDESTGRPEWWPENPVGVSFRVKGSKAPVHGTLLPNIEDPTARIKEPNDQGRSVGFGPIPPSWSPRPRYAGTHDERWERDRMPLPPEDFDPRFHHPVPPDQILRGYLQGGEAVILAGVRPEGGYSFAVPRLGPQLTIQIGEQQETPALRCDTLRVDCEAQRLYLVARASVVVQGRVNKVRWIKLRDENHASA